jgi:hypothetical protein
MSEGSERPVDWLEIVRKKVSAIRFGTVQIVVHDGRVTVVEATEKTRVSDPHEVRDDPRRAPRRN